MAFKKEHKTNIGRFVSNETREKIANAQRGIPRKKHTEDWKRQQSERLRQQHASGMRKNIFTLEVRQKMSNARKNGIAEGRIFSWNKGTGEPDRKRIYARKWMSKKIQTDPIFKLHARLRCRMNHYFKGHKPRSTRDLVGVDFETIKEHIEKQFMSGMSWDNYGSWHIDHIIPISLAKTIDEALELWHYTNLQPLWAHLNLQKSDRLISFPFDAKIMDETL